MSNIKLDIWKYGAAVWNGIFRLGYEPLADSSENCVENKTGNVRVTI